MTRSREKEILHILQNNFSLPSWNQSNRDPFRTLIVTVISQNTTNKNTARAFKNLLSRFRITPEALTKVSVTEIEEAIKVAGLYKRKSKIIKKISQIILEQFRGSLDFIYFSQFEEARKTLLRLPGVGPKTADVVLLFSAERPTVPVDTHVNRVSKRLGLASPNANYEEVRQALQSLFPPRDYLAVHVLLISLGRRYCRAKKPSCNACPVNTLCPSK